MENNFEIGDIVYLKTGSPSMCISYKRGPFWNCDWFDGHTSKQAQFHYKQLIKEILPAKK